MIFSMNAYHLSKIKKFKTTLSGFEVKGTTKGWIDGTSSPTHWFVLILIHWIVIYPVDRTIHCLNRSEGQSFNKCGREFNTLLPIKRHRERRMVQKGNLGR